MFFVRLLVAVLMVSSATCSWSQVTADSPDRYRQDVAGARPQPAYDPLGIRLGGFVARWDGDFDIGYNSNIFGRSGSVVGDSYYRISPSLSLTSDWGHDAVSLSGGAVVTRFFDQQDQNTNEYHIQTGSHVGLGDSVTTSSNIDYAHEAEPRGSTGNRLTAGEPVYLNRVSASLDSRYAAAAVTVETLLVYRQIRYAAVRIDGISTSQRFRASDGIGGRATLLYKIAPAASALFQVVGDTTRNPHDEFCCLRNAHGFALLSGIRLDNSGLLVGQAAIGFRKRYFDGSKTSSSGVTYDARLEWYPTALVTVTLTAEQQFRNSGIVAANTALVGTQSVAVDYELLRNLLINVQAGHESNSYRRINTHADLKTVSFRATYTPKRMIQLAAFAKLQLNNSNRQSVVSEFHGFQAGLRARFRL